MGLGIEDLRGANEPEDPLLHEVVGRRSGALVAVGDVEHQADVRRDQRLTRRGVACLDARGQRALLIDRKQPVRLSQTR